MSHFRQIAMQFKDRDSLVKALKDLGFDPEVHEVPKFLLDWHRNTQRIDENNFVKANIIIRKRQIGGMSNDLGFIWNESTKSYDMIRSDYDTNNARCCDQVRFVERLKSAYGHHYLHKIAESIGATVMTTMNAEGRRRYELRTPAKTQAVTSRR